MSCLERMRHDILSDVKLDVFRKPHEYKICMNGAAVHRHKPIFRQNKAHRIQDGCLKASNAPSIHK